jgi:hypothetical protein
VENRVPRPSSSQRTARLNRYGVGIGVPLVTSICAIWSAAACAQEVSVRQLQQNSYEMVLTNQSNLGESEAQAYIANAAVSVCGGLSPVLGKYRFESKESLGTGPTRVPGSFRFTQQVSCVPVSLTAPPQRASKPTSPEEVERIRGDITKRSEEYFYLLAAKKFDVVFSELREGAIGADKTTWVRDRRAFQALAGDPIDISIVKITVYDNPPEAPEPGIYVAADFKNAYGNVPYECGYLMWHRPDGGTFGITRTEIGHVTKESLKQIPEAQRPELLRKLRCVAP